MRRALGRQLAALRNRAGFSQWELAPLTGYSRSTLSDAELGRHRLRREFWLRCDEVLSADGRLTGSYDRIETTAALIRQRALSAAQVARDQRASVRLRAVRPVAPAETGDGGPLSAPATGPDLAGSPLPGQTCPHCDQPIAVVIVPAAPAASPP
jgi:transcriptional regulator with XRE-family HTH domain